MPNSHRRRSLRGEADEKHRNESWKKKANRRKNWTKIIFAIAPYALAGGRSAGRPEPGTGERSLRSLLHGERLKKLLRRMLDEEEFLSAFGLRSMSKVHLEEPCSLTFGGMQVNSGYTPGEAQTRLFGGKSNWRRPIWMPVNSLRKFHAYFGPDYRVEWPVGSGAMLNLEEVAGELGRRLQGLFLKEENGRRPSLKHVSSVDDYVLFHEYFHGDTGEGLGASHQTG